MIAPPRRTTGGHLGAPRCREREGDPVRGGRIATVMAGAFRAARRTAVRTAGRTPGDRSRGARGTRTDEVWFPLGATASGCPTPMCAGPSRWRSRSSPTAAAGGRSDRVGPVRRESQPGSRHRPRRQAVPRRFSPRCTPSSTRGARCRPGSPRGKSPPSATWRRSDLHRRRRAGRDAERHEGVSCPAASHRPW